MTKLYIDRGNTALKWQVLGNGELLNEGVVSNEIALDEGLIELNKHNCTAIYVSSVGSNDFVEFLGRWAKKHNQPAPVFLESCREACGVVNVYKEPGQLGVDRWLAMIAAYHKYTDMLCVVDSGTALTMDFVSESGQHLGGFIVPGSELMKNSLLSNTSKIDVGDITLENRLGENTSEAVIFGVEQMLGSFVQAKVLEVGAQYQQDVTVILTGGHANVLMENLSIPVHVENDLVIQGLQRVSNQ